MISGRFVFRVTDFLLYGYVDVDGLGRAANAVGAGRSGSSHGDAVGSRRRAWLVDGLGQRLRRAGVEAGVAAVGDRDAVNSRCQGRRLERGRATAQRTRAKRRGAVKEGDRSARSTRGSGHRSREGHRLSDHTRGVRRRHSGGGCLVAVAGTTAADEEEQHAESEYCQQALACALLEAACQEQAEHSHAVEAGQQHGRAPRTRRVLRVEAGASAQLRRRGRLGGDGECHRLRIQSIERYGRGAEAAGRQ